MKHLFITEISTHHNTQQEVLSILNVHHNRCFQITGKETNIFEINARIVKKGKRLFLVEILEHSEIKEM